METVLGALLLAAFVWWLIKGRESSAAILHNGMLVFVSGAVGLLLLFAGGGATVLGLALLAYAGWGVYRTVPWIRERLDPDGD